MTYNGNIERGISDKIIFNGTFFICPFCSEPFRALAYHTRQVHNLKGRDLREMFGLPYNYSLQTKDLKELRREMALLNEMDKQLIKTGINTRFKKGQFREDLRELIRRGHIKTIRKIEVL